MHPKLPREDEGQRHDMLGGSYTRKQLNGHWVQYTFYDSDNEMTRRVAFPRVPVISDEVIEAGEREDELDEANA